MKMKEERIRNAGGFRSAIDTGESLLGELSNSSQNFAFSVPRGTCLCTWVWNFGRGGGFAVQSGGKEARKKTRKPNTPSSAAGVQKVTSGTGPVERVGGERDIIPWSRD